MLEFFNSIWQWILETPDRISAAIDYMFNYYEIIYYQLLIDSVNSLVQFITEFMNSSSYLSTFETTYGALSQDTRFAIEYLNIPEALILILSAMSLRFLLKSIF